MVTGTDVWWEVWLCGAVSHTSEKRSEAAEIYKSLAKEKPNELVSLIRVNAAYDVECQNISKIDYPL